MTGKRELDVIRSFLCDLLDVAHWNLPADNEGIEKALREAVASGRLVPVIDRERRALARVTRPDCAPERCRVVVDLAMPADSAEENGPLSWMPVRDRRC